MFIAIFFLLLTFKSLQFLSLYLCHFPTLNVSPVYIPFPEGRAGEVKLHRYKLFIRFFLGGGRSWVRASQIYSNMYSTRCNFTQFIYIWKPLYMFRVLLPPIIRSAYNCIYSIWYLSRRCCYMSLAGGSSKFASCWIYIGIYLLDCPC
jgi:hypothetical protein